MEDLFLNVVQWISDNRVWIMPIALLVVGSALVHQAYLFFEDIQREME